jgi:hypothetical protein
MKSFRQYILENWSYARKNEWKKKSAGKYIFHVTDTDEAKKIISQNQLVPSNPKSLEPMLTNLKASRKILAKLGLPTGEVDTDVDIVKRRATNVFFSRGVGDKGASTESWMRQKGHIVLKFPIANIPRNLARRFRVDYEGSEIAQKRDRDNPSAITIKGSFPR